VEANIAAGAGVMANARGLARRLARQGKTVGEITGFLDSGLDEVERELVWRIAVDEMRRAERERAGMAPATERPNSAARRAEPI
jgi:hypothetical protein